MDPATLFMIVMLADGSERQSAPEVFHSVVACEAFVQEALEKKPSDLKVKSYECRPHYRVAK